MQLIGELQTSVDLSVQVYTELTFETLDSIFSAIIIW